MTETGSQRLKSSFRDPSGYLFRNGDTLYRQVNQEYRDNYDLLMSSGLYDELTTTGHLIPHEEVDAPILHPTKSYRILKPEKVDFISYPYEWCFSQIKDAALLTLDIQRTAMDHGMSLKDASAYNIQFHKGRAVFIDTLSFESLHRCSPWVAYRQFCRQFLGPLVLLAKRDIRLGQLLRAQIDGIPLDLVSKLLPASTWMSPSLLLHLHLHAVSQKFLAGSKSTVSAKRLKRMSPRALEGLIDSLRSTVDRLEWRPLESTWTRYRDCMNYTQSSYRDKRDLVAKYLDEISPSSVWDLGSNDGDFSRIAAGQGIVTVSFDNDFSLVERNYRRVRSDGEERILPLVMDLCNPSSPVGWAEGERDSLLQRGPAGCILALAIVHHLSIGNNVPFEDVAAYFRDMGQHLIVEFVHRDDSQVCEMLKHREDIFKGYRAEQFEKAFGRYYRIREREPVGDSKRTLYLMEGI